MSCVLLQGCGWRYYVRVLLNKLGLLDTTSGTYQQADDALHRVSGSKIILLIVFELKNNDEEFGCPPCVNDIAYISKRHCVQVLLNDLGLLDTTSGTYQQANSALHHGLRQQNNTLDFVFELKNNKEFGCLPCINWLPRVHKIPSGAGFIIAGKKCIGGQLNKHVASAFKLCYSQIDACQKNTVLVGPKPFG